MTKSQRRRLQRRLAEERKLAGTFVSRSRKSHYRTADIRAAVQSDVQSMWQQIEAHNDRAVDREWSHRRAGRKRHPVIQVTDTR